MCADLNNYLESVLEDTGGLGRFQFVLTLIVMGSKATVAWSVLMMTFGGAIPDWSCNWQTDSQEDYMPNTTFSKKCHLDNDSVSVLCVSKKYDPGMTTIVSEWDLVCHNDWVMSSITTIQMFGLLIGAFISGQIGDLFGRKPTYYISIVILLIFNVIATFSNGWKMFAAVRFFIGIGCGWYLTIDIAYLAELVPMKYRSVILSLPLWPVGAMTFSLISYLLHDWRHIQIACAIFCLPWFLGVCIIPESYRWLVSHKRIDEAHDVITKIAKMNNRPVPDKQKLIEMVLISERQPKDKKYTIIDVCRNRHLLKITLLLTFCWMTCGYGFYAILFGVQQLSGVLYVNMALLGLMESTSFGVSLIVNCVGRKLTCCVFFLTAGICGLTVGILQHTGGHGQIINGFAYATKLSVACGWMALIIFTSELYPTVVRNIGFGFQNTMSRVGSTVAPQLVFASSRVPGIMYLLMGGLFLIASVCVYLLTETNKTALKTTIEEYIASPEKIELSAEKSQKTTEVKYDPIKQNQEKKYNVLTKSENLGF